MKKYETIKTKCMAGLVDLDTLIQAEIELASTKKGRADLNRELKENADSPTTCARLQHSLAQGVILQERNKAVRDAVLAAKAATDRYNAASAALGAMGVLDMSAAYEAETAPGSEPSRHPAPMTATDISGEQAERDFMNRAAASLEATDPETAAWLTEVAADEGRDFPFWGEALAEARKTVPGDSPEAIVAPRPAAAAATTAAPDTSYRLQHRAPCDDSNDPEPYNANIAHLTSVFPQDVHARPELYGTVDEETIIQLRGAHADPKRLVRIYRAVPPGVETVNPGDWVTLSRAYAETHADDGWSILTANVPATQVWSDGNDLSEYGWDAGTGQSLAGTRLNVAR